MNIKVTGTDRKKATKQGNRSPKASKEKFQAEPFKIILNTYSDKYPMGKRLFM